MDWNHLHNVPHLITWLWQFSGKSRFGALPRKLLRYYIAPMVMSPLRLLCWDCEAICMLGDRAYCTSMVLGEAVAVFASTGGFLVERPNGDVVMLRPNAFTTLLHTNARLASDFIYRFNPAIGSLILMRVRFEPDGEPIAQDYARIDMPDLAGKVVTVFHGVSRIMVAVWSGRDIRIMHRDREIKRLQFHLEPISVIWRNVYGFIGFYSWGESEILQYDHRHDTS